MQCVHKYFKLKNLNREVWKLYHSEPEGEERKKLIEVASTLYEYADKQYASDVANWYYWQQQYKRKKKRKKK
jgi:hypothetical protein